MLEVKNLYKVYRPKKGMPVTALKDVSLKFPEKGMVFILGKSGSGFHPPGLPCRQTCELPLREFSSL